MRTAKVITSFLLLICMGAGIWMIAQGVGTNAHRKANTQNYEETVGYCVDWEKYNTSTSTRKPGHKHSHTTTTTYAEIYQYQVDGQTYTVKTDYGTGMPAIYGEEKTVYYNPENPAEAYLEGSFATYGLIWAGLFFLAVPMVFVVAFLVMTDRFGRFATNIMDLTVGVVTLITSLAFSYFMSGTVSPVGVWRAVGPLALFPLMFLAVSLLMLKRGLFGRPKWMTEGKK